MHPGCASLSLWEVPLLLGVLPILSGCLEPLMLHTTARPSLTSSDTYCFVCLFSPSVAVGGVYRSPLLWILPILWIFPSMLGGRGGGS